MDSNHKFLFETSFDDAASGTDESRRKRRIYSQIDLEAASEKARADALVQAVEDADRSVENQVSMTLAALTERLAAIDDDLAATRVTATQYGVETAISLIRKVMPALAHRHGLSEVEAVVTDCLATLFKEPHIVVRVDDSLLDPLQARIGDLSATTGFAGQIVLMGETGMAPGDCRVEWADGGAERESARLWDEIDAATDRILGWADGDSALVPEPESNTNGGALAPNAGVSNA